MKKPRSIAADDSSPPVSGLPDEIVLEIVNKIIDLKTLIFCKLVSKHFSSIVHKTDTISLTVPSDSDNKTCESFCSAAFMSMNKFTCVKSLHIKLPIFTRQQQQQQQQQQGFWSKWKLNFGNKGETFVFLSPNSIYDTNNNRLVFEEEEDVELSGRKYNFALSCYEDAFMRVIMLFHRISNFPLLENVSIRDWGKMGKISVNGGRKTKTVEVREWRNLLCKMEVKIGCSKCYIPLLELPVSGYVMKAVTLVLIHTSAVPDGDESFENGDFEDKEEAVYGEAIMEIFKKHKDRIQRVR